MSLQVQVVSPERVLWTGEAQMVTARTIDGGDIAFLTGHVHFVGALDVGTTLIRPASGDDVFVAIHGGFVEVSDNNVSILSDVAELAGDIDVERATAASERARASLLDGHDVEIEAALRRANVRLEAASR